MKIDEASIRAIEIVVKTLAKEGIDCVIVGALVPSILVLHGLADDLTNRIRPTRDIDTAISVDSWEQFKRARVSLIGSGFNKIGSSENKLKYGLVEVDLVPAGQLMSESGMAGSNAQKQLLNMLSFQETLANAEVIELSPGLEVKVAPLWAFAMLKIMAFADRKQAHDANDIFVVLDSYESATGRRFDAPAGTVFTVAGAYICGEDTSSHVSSGLKDGLIGILDKHLENGEYAEIISCALREMKVLESEEEQMRLYELLKAYRNGMLSTETGGSYSI